MRRRLCVVADTDEPPLVEPLADPPGLKRKSRARTLRTYTYLAQRFHHCDNCHQPISPGEQYEGSVEIMSNGKLMVWRRHVSPVCEWPEDPVDEDANEKDEGLQTKEAA